MSGTGPQYTKEYVPPAPGQARKVMDTGVRETKSSSYNKKPKIMIDEEEEWKDGILYVTTIKTIIEPGGVRKKEKSVQTFSKEEAKKREQE